jgi:hypothetical protein
MTQPNPEQPNPPKQNIQQYTHQPIGARVPDRVSRGVFSTGQVIMDSPKEFVIDFLQGATRPFQVVARVVVTPQTMQEFAKVLRDNLDKYIANFGEPPPPPTPPNPHRPTLQELYDNFKVPDDLMSGSYANSVLIGHSPTEFFIDFITGFYPHAAVSARVFLPAPQVPKFLDTLQGSIKNYEQRHGKKQERPEEPFGLP